MNNKIRGESDAGTTVCEECDAIFETRIILGIHVSLEHNTFLVTLITFGLTKKLKLSNLCI